jgi:hypothetical protein
MKAKIKKNKNNDYYTKMNESNGKEFTFEATPADIITGKHLRESNYYKPNQHYPQKICGKCFMDMAIKVQQYMMELLNDDGDVGIEEITALRSLDAIVHERTKEVVEDFAKDLANDYDTKPYEKKPKFDVGDVVRFDAKEYDGNRKYGVIVEAYEEDGETKYSVYLGHNTLSGITEPILYDMLGIEKYKK